MWLVAAWAWTLALVPPSPAVRSARAALEPVFEAIDWRTHGHMARVLEAFRRAEVSPSDFGGVDGYGHGDLGREKIDAIYAELFGAEAAMVRVQCFSGTHAIACALYGVLRPGDTMLTVSGAPYDTLEEVLGTRAREASGLTGSLADFGVHWECVDLTPEGTFDYPAIERALERIEAGGRVAMVHVQRSCGYAWRRSLPVAEIGELASWLDGWKHAHGSRRGAPPSGAAARGGVQGEAAREEGPRAGADHASDAAAPWQPSWPVLFVDNCYGEFVEECEPTAVGADLVAGSLIKNPGGTLALTGGYVAGRAALVQAASNRLSAPGVEGGATLGQNRALLQGLFHAPQVVGEALKGAHLAAQTLGARGYACNPPPLAPAAAHDMAVAALAARADIVQAIRLGSRERLIAFCEVVQRFSPISAHVRPVAGTTPGYGDPVVFADGTFVDGSTAELTADGPLREPFVVYMQGGTHWTHWALVLDAFLELDEEAPC